MNAAPGPLDVGAIEWNISGGTGCPRWSFYGVVVCDDRKGAMTHGAQHQSLFSAWPPRMFCLLGIIECCRL